MVQSPLLSDYAYCTRCGAQVAPYTANQEGRWIIGEQHDDYAQPMNQHDELTGSAHYWCPVCKSRWVALNETDTAFKRGCGHFMPPYVDYCAICGAKCSEGS